MPLNRLSDHDYELDGDGCWIRAGNVLILLRRTMTKVYATFYRTGREAEGPIAQTSASQFDRRDKE